MTACLAARKRGRILPLPCASGHGSKQERWLPHSHPSLFRISAFPFVSYLLRCRVISVKKTLLFANFLNPVPFRNAEGGKSSLPINDAMCSSQASANDGHWSPGIAFMKTSKYLTTVADNKQCTTFSTFILRVSHNAKQPPLLKMCACISSI